MIEKNVVTNKGMVRAEFNFWVGKYLNKFYDNLQNKKIVGNKCPKCSDVFVPPRQVCGKCNEKLSLDENWIDLPNTGVLVNFTQTKWKVTERGSRKSKDQIIGMIQIDGSNTALIFKLLDINFADLKIGMKFKIKWADETKGEPGDIKGFERIGGII
ncbi:MAG: hypothetical protein GY870_07595 [archaeon]|nr:hypothetical protein [archaeon]